MTLDDADDLEDKGFKDKKHSPDPWSDWLRTVYAEFKKPMYKPIIVGCFVSPIVLTILFAILISNSFSNVVAFGAFCTSILFIGISMWMLCWILEKDEGPASMREISDTIREGAEGFFITQYGTIFRFAFIVSFILFLIYLNRSPSANSQINDLISPTFMAFIVMISFLIGAHCSALSGYAGIWVSVRANLRVAAAARKDYNDAMQICFRGGAFSAIINVALAIFGISLMYLSISLIFWWNATDLKQPPIEEIPVLVAMFAQLGGGIYTKAADVGADLIGKVEAGIPEDDPRNPATIADLVGDNVGDCAGQCADLFESISAEILSAMILGGSLANHAHLDFETKSGLILFPLLVHSLDLTVSTIAVFFVQTKPGLPQHKHDYGELEDPLHILKRGYYVSLVLAVFGLFYICRVVLNIPGYGNAYLCFFGCSLVGVCVSYMFVIITQYYTDYNFGPVQSIAKSS